MSDYLFGPVPSRRLGRSLGIDLVPYKTCTYNCVYCQLGQTTNRTLERKEWVPHEAVLEEIRKKLTHMKGIDFFTFAGSGEPTLHTHIGRIIEEVKSLSPVPVAVLTNGSLLWQREVQDDLLAADVVLPSLDTPDGRLFRHVNRPHPELVFEKILEGLCQFRERFSGKIWLEIFFLTGMNSMEKEVQKLVDLVPVIQPDLVQLTTVTRPPQEEFAKAVSAEQMKRLAGLFDVPVEVVAAIPSISGDIVLSAGRDQIIQLLERRACSIPEIAMGQGISWAEARKYVEDLFVQGQVEVLTCNGESYYRANRC